LTSTSGAIGLLMAGVSENAIQGLTNVPLTFYTNNSERMRIDSSGNVGIGTSSPSYFVQANKNQNSETGFAMFNTNNSASASVGFYQKVYNASGYLNGQETQYLTYGGAYSGTPLSGGPSGAQAIIATGGYGAPIVFGRAGTFSGMWDSSGNLLVGATTNAGSVSNSQQIVGGAFKSVSGANSIATNTATTVLTFPTNSGIYLVTMILAGTGAPATDDSVAIVCVNAGSATQTDLKTGTNMVISLSGLNLQATQKIFAGANVNWSVMRFGQ
jgi:hypothetical protein